MTYDFRKLAATRKPLYDYDSAQRSYLIEDYPSGFTARCQKRVWLEFKKAKASDWLSRHRKSGTRTASRLRAPD